MGKVICLSVMIVVAGLFFLCYAPSAEAADGLKDIDSDKPIEGIAKYIYGLLSGWIAKVIALMALITAAIAALNGKWHIAIGAFVACLLLAFAPQIINGLFGVTAK